MMRGIIVSLLLFITAVVYAGNTRSVYYRGTMIGEDSKPVSGVFPMNFRLYKNNKSRHPIWSETLWVAVDEGGYIVRLGMRNRLPVGRLDQYVIGIKIRGIGEVLREQFHPALIMQKPDRNVKLPPVPKNVAKTKQAGTSSYADTAGFATEAGHAKSADSIGGLTLDQIMQKLGDVRQPGKGGSVSIGTARKYGNRVGGNGGTTEYNEQCPEGYVMVGLRGAYGLYLDSTQIVCAPLLTK